MTSFIILLRDQAPGVNDAASSLVARVLIFNVGIRPQKCEA